MFACVCHVCAYICVHACAYHCVCVCHSIHVESPGICCGSQFSPLVMWVWSCEFWRWNSVVKLGSQCPYLPVHLISPTSSLETGSFLAWNFPSRLGCCPREPYLPRPPPLPLPPQDWDMICAHPCLAFYVDPSIWVSNKEFSKSPSGMWLAFCPGFASLISQMLLGMSCWVKI